MIDSDALGELIAELVGEHVELALAPLVKANAELASENRTLSERVEHLQATIDAIQPAPVISDEIISAVAARALEQIAVPAPPEVDPAAIVPLVVSCSAFDERVAAAAAAAALPAPEAIAPDMDLIRSMLTEMVAAIPPAKEGAPGVGVAGALKDAEGHLILTLSDGRLVDIGKVDGNPGKNGETFTLDDFDIIALDERTIKLSFERGDQRHSFELEFPVPVYRGVWREGETYSRGDMVTWAGSTWHCEEKSTAKPGEVAGDWTLAVKAGRPGRDKTN